VALLSVMVVCLLATLVARLAYVQLLDQNKPIQTAGITHAGVITVPATRGQIVDSRGRVLVGNKTISELTIDRSRLEQLPDHGAAVIVRVAALLGMKAADLSRQITPCGIAVPAPCWTGEPYQPVPVATGIDDQVTLAVSEHAEQFPGVEITTQTVPDYPGGTLAAHLLGYTGAVSAQDQKSNPHLVDADTIGQSGLEESYDSVLRGVDGQVSVQLDARGEPVGSSTVTKPAQQGSTLVTSIDADVQARAEQALANQIQISRGQGKLATSGALVVMDPHTGRVIAAASYPSYDPTEFIGGISVANYQKLLDPAANDPLVSRAIAGQYAPGSTFKLISLSDDLTDGSLSTDGSYPCPGSLDVDGRIKTNYDSESFGGSITPAFALQVSCDTFFYAPAVAEYYADEARIAAGQKPLEPLQAMAGAFGVGSAPGIDLPADEQASGSMADRESRMARWKADKDEYCAEAKKGYPEEADPATRAYLTELASENCTDGWRYRAGDNADMAIGQGETTVSPLQLAMAYSAMVNGGTLYAPTIGWGVVNGAGKLTRTITPKVIRKVPVSKQYLDFFGDSLHFQDSHSVSGAIAFDGSPIKLEIGGKTGTAEVYGKQDTSWFASWGPVQPGATVGTAKFVMVGMIEQAGLGSSAAAPMVRQMYESVLGAYGKPLLSGARPASTMPGIAALVPASDSDLPAASPGVARSPSQAQSPAGEDAVVLPGTTAGRRDARGGR
jgi:penicillin-binding protein 2